MRTRRVLVTQGWGRWVRAARPERRVRAGGDECPRRQRGNSDAACRKELSGWRRARGGPTSCSPPDGRTTVLARTD
uniref:Uncharacterized protein n=1 Tax=Oryza meridionalis TaxID=40149 RepID=A0A0E0DNH0_9ORYZ